MFKIGDKVRISRKAGNRYDLTIPGTEEIVKDNKDFFIDFEVTKSLKVELKIGSRFYIESSHLESLDRPQRKLPFWW